MAEKESGAFVRWQEIRNNQLSDVNRLIIGLASGLLAILNVKADQMKSLTPLQRESGIASALLAAVSLLFGVWIAANRYRSFKTTAWVARMREQTPSAKDRTPEERQRITELRASYRSRDNRSSWLFDLQLWTFFFGAMAFAAMEFLTLSSR
jgi:hypothetical protein